MTTKTIKYIETDIGSDKTNPLCQIRDEDITYILNYLMESVRYFSDLSQKKSLVWEDMVKRLPKHLHKGANGPNSIMSFCLGLMTNMYFNIQKYNGKVRLSRKQIEDLDFCTMCIAMTNDKFDVIKFRRTDFAEINGDPMDNGK
jgi:hypothetical protein